MANGVNDHQSGARWTGGLSEYLNFGIVDERDARKNIDYTDLIDSEPTFGYDNQFSLVTELF